MDAFGLLLPIVSSGVSRSSLTVKPNSSERHRHHPDGADDDFGDSLVVFSSDELVKNTAAPKKDSGSSIVDNQDSRKESPLSCLFVASFEGHFICTKCRQQRHRLEPKRSKAAAGGEGEGMVRTEGFPTFHQKLACCLLIPLLVPLHNVQDEGDRLFLFGMCPQ